MGMNGGERLTLGLDLGSGSVGWSLLAGEGETRRLLALGVRRFEAGVSGDIEGGRDESNAVERRNKRGPRRQGWRRRWRLRKVFHTLQKHDLLPATDDDSPDARHQLMLSLDAELQALDESLSHVDRQLLPYRLRATALDKALKPYALGRVIYHLAQRRGFLSNRKVVKQDDDRSAVKRGITQLAAEMQRTGARTLGEYFAGLDPHQEKIRRRWTARSMFHEEFEAIWSAQSSYYPHWTEKTKADLYRALFHQRPLKSQAGLIGRCELEPRRRRAPLACLLAQRIRLLQMVNDLQLTSPDGEVRKLTEGERTKLLDALERTNELNDRGELSWAKVLKTIGLKNERSAQHKWGFNFESGGRKGMLGNRTAAKISLVLGDRWHDMVAEKQLLLVDDMLRFESEKDLANHLKNFWRFPQQVATALSEVEFEPGYHSLSRRAIRKLLMHMELGHPLATARKTVYGDRLLAAQDLDSLPSLHKAIPSLRNPAVARALSELRKVVNALIRRYGKPDIVRIELSRDLKHSRERRKSMADHIKENEEIRKFDGKRLRDAGFRDSPTNILKVRLADECGWFCPYTGKSFGMAELVGDHPQYDIEHIIPLSRSLDNSFGNKTLCYHDENRHRKGNRTPWEAYGGSDQFEAIVERVKRFKGNRKVIAMKLERFQQQEFDAEAFASQQLNDTRYMSRLAADYLGLLFGGRIDREGRRRIETPTGGVTGYLRKYWGLNAILGRPDDKNRSDHRHHAIDAVVIALSDAAAVQTLAQAARIAESTYTRLFADIDPPWSTLVDDVRIAVEQVVVSSRVNRKLNGPLHKDTIFSKPKIKVDNQGRAMLDQTGKPILVHHVRVKLDQLKNLEDIVDAKVREVVRRKLDQIGLPADKAFKDPNNHPCLEAKDGRLIPIHKVRIRKSDKPILVGHGTSQRYVNAGSNHHMEVVAVLEPDSREKKWEGHLVSRFEAIQRKRCGEPIIRRDHGKGRVFKFSVSGSEHLMIKRGAEELLYRVESISDNQLELVLHNDARPITVRKKIGADARVRMSPSKLKELQARKVTVSPLGEILPAHD